MRNILTALCAAVLLTACAGALKPDPQKPAPLAFRVHAEAEGKASLAADIVPFGAPVRAFTAHATAGGTADFNSDRDPPVVLEGSWQIDHDSNPQGPGIEIRAAAPKAKASPRRVVLDGVECEVTPISLTDAPIEDVTLCGLESPCGPSSCAPPPPAAPRPAASPCAPTLKAAAADTDPITGQPCGQPVYVGCDGTPGGHRPEPTGNLCPAIPAGTGWPCSGGPMALKAGPGAPIVGAIAIPPHLVECLIKGLGTALTCFFSGI